MLPSASLKFAATPNTAVRIVYSRALSRPDPQDISKAVGPVNDTQKPPTVSLGNPDLKPEHANNFDVLLEQYLAPLGLIQAGYFYKALAIRSSPRKRGRPRGRTPVISCRSRATPAARRCRVSRSPTSSTCGFLPGVFGGLGSRRTTATRRQRRAGLPLRTDSPPLLRQAPHTWNISPTYDRGPMSIRLGMSYNGANIYRLPVSEPEHRRHADKPGDLTAGGTAGPGGDNYLYSHLQLDAQANVRVGTGLSVMVYGLNLNNEVFGFYNGSPQYVVQREFYKPTFAFGVRWVPSLK